MLALIYGSWWMALIAVIAAVPRVLAHALGYRPSRDEQINDARSSRNWWVWNVLIAVVFIVLGLAAQLWIVAAIGGGLLVYDLLILRSRQARLRELETGR